MPKRALLIANQHSRRCRELADEAKAALTANGIEHTQPDLPEKEHVPDLIRSSAPGHDCVVVMGGDGTVNLCLNALRDLKLPVGLLPAGTANDLARTLGIPLEVKEAVDVIAAGHLSTVDVAEVNGKPYLNAASFGLTSDITQQLDKETKRRWGVLAYVMASWRALRRARGFSARIEGGDQLLHMRSMQVVVGNGHSFGGGMKVDADARIDDGILHVYSIMALPWWKVLLLLPALRMGTHAKSDKVFNAAGRDFTISTHRPIPVSADGELLCDTPATFKVHRAALQFFAPAKSAK